MSSIKVFKVGGLNLIVFCEILNASVRCDGEDDTEMAPLPCGILSLNPLMVPNYLPSYLLEFPVFHRPLVFEHFVFARVQHEAAVLRLGPKSGFEGVLGIKGQIFKFRSGIWNDSDFGVSDQGVHTVFLRESVAACQQILDLVKAIATKVKFPTTKFAGSNQLRYKETKMELTITRPDDWHLHLRDGELLEAVVPHSASQFGRGIVMPNLKPPITTTAAALAYQESILKALPAGSDFTPLMTLYLTDTTDPKEITLARRSGVVFAVKLYPAGATTNSQDGVTDLFGRCLPVLEEMVVQNMPLLVHGEVTDPDVDVFDREKVFIDSVLRPLIQRLPQLKIVMEHITTMDAVKFVESCEEGSVAATVTPQHLLLNRNALFQGGLQPHNYCLPVLKREIHRQAIVSAVTSGSKRFFLGTDSAPHEKRRKECPCGCAGIYSAPIALSLYAKVFEEAGALDKLEAFTSFNGPDFYGLPRNTSKTKLSRTSWKVPECFSFPFGDIIPMFAGKTLEWQSSFN